MLTCEIRGIEIWEHCGVRNKNVTLSDQHMFSVTLFRTAFLSLFPQIHAFTNISVLWREEHNFFVPFYVDIQMAFLPYILSAGSSGPHHANQTGCHSVSHFVQFHVLSSWKEENYVDRLKPFPYWNGRFVSFLSALVHCLLMSPR